MLPCYGFSCHNNIDVKIHKIHNKIHFTATLTYTYLLMFLSLRGVKSCFVVAQVSLSVSLYVNLFKH